jgi:two-component system, OmpR family, sensor histidine kinase KdpD
VFLAAAGIASTVAEVARHRAEEAELRRREADLAAEMARSCSVARRCRTRCRPSGGASRRRSISPRRASSSPRWRPTRAASGCRSTSGAGGRGRSWCRPPSSRGARARQGADRAALEALLAAALDREALQSEVVETQALRRSDVIKTALLRAVSHDLRSPLTAIVTAGSALRSAGLDPAEREELAAVVTGEASRLARLMDKLLDLSRLQAGRGAARGLVLDRGGRGGRGGRPRGAGRAARPPRARPRPAARPRRRRAARAGVLNLLENARRYFGDAPVQVRARVSGGRLLVRVVDRGPGIPPERLEGIFQPFYRDDDGGGHPGLGLGLAIARGFVEANGGRVWAESLPGQGDRVRGRAAAARAGGGAGAGDPPGAGSP